MKKNLLIIAGVTATGKTSIGLNLAKKFNGEIISADSRQVYKGMDIGTGKDIPRNFESGISNLEFRNKKIPFYSNSTKIWGYDLVKPNEEFSVAHFVRFTHMIIKDIFKRNKLPILVGGTGFYLKALTKPLSDIYVLRNIKLRRKIAKYSVERLQNELKIIAPRHFNKMNYSDRNNPRRLIRAIEIATQKKHQSLGKKSSEIYKKIELESVLWIGLTAPRPLLYKRIDKRVDERIKKGAEQEVKNLIANGYTYKLPSMSAMGYRHWQTYFEDHANKEKIIKRWKLDEHAYARRQLTWFKKKKDIHWFDVEKPDYKKKVVDKVVEWYSES